MDFSFRLKDIVDFLPDAVQVGEFNGHLNRIAAIEQADVGCISFLRDKKQVQKLQNTTASLVLIPASADGSPKVGQAFLKVANPSLSLSLICEKIAALHRVPRQPGIHASAIVSTKATVSAEAYIGPQCIVEDDAVIEAGAVLEAGVYIGQRSVVGPNSTLFPRVIVGEDCLIGKSCILYGGVVLGSDGFGYESSAAGHSKVAQIGSIILEDFVEIGANACVDRARFDETRIGEGTKIDNLVQIGHNVIIGKHCLICALVGISGSSRLGDFVTIAGQAGVAGHLNIGSRAIIGGQAGVTSAIPDGTYVTGTPARPFNKQRKSEAHSLRLDEYIKRIHALEKQVADLQGQK